MNYMGQLFKSYNLNFNIEKLETEALRIPELVSRREYVSNRNGSIQIHQDQWMEENYHSPYIDDIFWKELKKFISKIHNKHIDGQLWLNLNYESSYNSPHTHQGQYSGVFYIKAPENSGNIVFPKTDESVTPKENLLLLFNSDVMHAVEPNLSDDVRISIAFNYWETII